MKTLQTLGFAVTTLALAACGSQSPEQPRAGGAQAGCMTRAYDNIGGPISLVSHTGEAVTEENFKGRPTLIYFGFTYCPDICPGTLVAVKNAYDRLPDGIAPPQTVLITVDPERDTPEQLAIYVDNAAFPDNLVGLTGTPEQVREAADVFLADFSKIALEGSRSEYTMDHTSLLYLMGSDWTLKTFFAESAHDPEAMAECLAQHLR